MSEPTQRRDDRGGRRGPRARSAQAPSARTRSADPARGAAYEALRAVSEGAYANLVLPALLRERGLRGRDAALATELTHGTLRLRRLYDAVLGQCLDRPLEDLDQGLQDVLRLGSHQILSMRIPDHAAVTESVGLARQVLGLGPSALVNAVLRKVAERSLEEWRPIVLQAQKDAGGDTLGIEHSHPDWVIRAMRQALLGHGAATPESIDQDLVALLQADNLAPQVHLVTRPGVSGVEELAAGGAQALEYSPVGALLPHGDPGAIPAVREGRAAVQDEGSQLVALALTAAPLEGLDDAGSQWLDMCAGPGGKAALLAAVAHTRGASLLANELQDHRADLVAKSLSPVRRVGADANVARGDGRRFGTDQPGAFARVLVDAPCTGLGALRRRPEARWRHTPSDLSSLSPLQRELLASALETVAPGGVVAYSTCSPHLAETVAVVDDAVRSRDDIEVLNAAEILSSVTADPMVALGEGPYVQLWPHTHGTDGMFLALLRRRQG